MIIEGEKIAFKNVVSKYYQFDSYESLKIAEDFIALIDNKNLTPNGPLFYAVMSEFGAEPVSAMYSIPVEENRLKDIDDEDLMFQTYFLCEYMLMTRVLVDDTETIQETAVEKMAELYEYASKEKLDILAPFHNMFVMVDNQLFLEIYLGATRQFDSKRKLEKFYKKIDKKFMKGLK